MRHQKKTLKMNRDQDHKESLARNMITQLFLHEKIKTTEKKANFIQPKAERVLRNALSYENVRAIRYLQGIVRSETAARKTLEVFKDRYKDKKGGYTRIIKLGFRKGDNASAVMLQLT